jgi:hypothetical protein
MKLKSGDSGSGKTRVGKHNRGRIGLKLPLLWCTSEMDAGAQHMGTWAEMRTGLTVHVWRDGSDTKWLMEVGKGKIGIANSVVVEVIDGVEEAD